MTMKVFPYLFWLVLVVLSVFVKFVTWVIYVMLSALLLSFLLVIPRILIRRWDFHGQLVLVFVFLSVSVSVSADQITIGRLKCRRPADPLLASSFVMFHPGFAAGC